MTIFTVDPPHLEHNRALRQDANKLKILRGTQYKGYFREHCKQIAYTTGEVINVGFKDERGSTVGHE